MKFCTGVLGITLIITNTNFCFLTSCHALQGDTLGYSGAYFGILRLLFENRSMCSVKICTQTFLVFLLRVTALFFSISWPSLWGIFRLVLGNVYLILHKCSIFSHETLYRCSWHDYDGLYTENCFLYHVPRSLFSHIFLYF